MDTGRWAADGLEAARQAQAARVRPDRLSHAPGCLGEFVIRRCRKEEQDRLQDRKRDRGDNRRDDGQADQGQGMTQQDGDTVPLDQAQRQDRHRQPRQHVAEGDRQGDDDGKDQADDTDRSLAAPLRQRQKARLEQPFGTDEGRQNLERDLLEILMANRAVGQPAWQPWTVQARGKLAGEQDHRQAENGRPSGDRDRDDVGDGKEEK